MTEFEEWLRSEDEEFEYENNGETPAYPYGNNMGQYDGLTKREIFAMAAMQGILANKYSRTAVRKALDENGFMSEMKDVATVISEEAVIFADALLKELEATDDRH